MHPLHKAFSIGLAPLAPGDWIEVDDRLEAYLAEKDQLRAAFGQNVFVEEPDTRQSQSEILKLLTDHLLRRFPLLYVRTENGLTVNGSRHVALDDGEAPLWTAARLVQEDLVIMRRGAEGWRLAAASLSFPSSWSLQEKFGKALPDIHAPVPGFGPESRNAGLIDRIFDNLKVEQPVTRLNWGIYSNDRLYQPDRSAEHGAQHPGDFTGHFFRIERQTLRKMPGSGDILFTIRIHLDPLAALKRQPDAIGPFREQLCRLDHAKLAYKGLTAKYDQLIKSLDEMARA